MFTPFYSFELYYNNQQEYLIHHFKDVGGPTMSETTRKKLRELAGEERFIPGIYNWIAASAHAGNPAACATSAANHAGFAVDELVVA